VEDGLISSETYVARTGCCREGFSLTELLVVISIISLLMGVLLPALGQVRRQGREVLGMNNLRQIVATVNSYALDNDERYPESIATITFGNSWHWQEPRMMTACKPRPSRMHRSMSAYLRSYLADARVMFCPNAPQRYKYLQQAWDAGDDWDNPETSFPGDPLIGAYCFYWDYVGFLPDRQTPFRGPQNTLAYPGQSKLLVSDYFGYDHYRSPNAYGRCEKLGGASITLGTEVSSAYWSRPDAGGNINLDTLKIRLHAGYTDGHIGSFTPVEAIPMEVSIAPDGSAPYPIGVGLGPGVFYLPRSALH